MSNNNVEDEDDLTCLPPDLDTSDRIACDKFYDIANDEQKRALDALSIQRITDTIKSISRECRKMNKKFDNLIRYSASVQGVRAGQPISFQVEVDGKKFPDDMPEAYRSIRTFEDVMALPIDCLRHWLTFHKQDYTDEMSHVYKAKMLFVAMGGTMNDCVRRYEREAQAGSQGTEMAGE